MTDDKKYYLVLVTVFGLNDDAAISQSAARVSGQTQEVKHTCYLFIFCDGFPTTWPVERRQTFLRLISQITAESDPISRVGREAVCVRKY